MSEPTNQNDGNLPEDLKKTLLSLRTTKTGAAVVEVYKNGKVDFSVGGNTIQDLMRTVIRVISEELQSAVALAEQHGRELERERIEKIITESYHYTNTPYSGLKEIIVESLKETKAAK